MMVLTTVRVCLVKAGSRSTQDSLLRSSIRLALVAFCLALLSGCGDAETSSQFDEIAMAKGGPVSSTINLNPSTFAFSVTEGDSHPTHTLSISNLGKGVLKWSASATASWLTLSPSTGSAQGSTSDTVTAAANLSGMAPGTYSATITVFGAGATNTPQDIPVTLTIAAAPTATSASSLSPTTSTWTMATASATLSWNAQSDPSVTGYYVHYGTQSPSSLGSCTYAQSVYYSVASLASASSPTATIGSLTTGTTYYFAVSAYNGHESLCSNEVAKAASRFADETSANLQTHSAGF